MCVCEVENAILFFIIFEDELRSTDNDRRRRRRSALLVPPKKQHNWSSIKAERKKQATLSLSLLYSPSITHTQYHTLITSVTRWLC